MKKIRIHFAKPRFRMVPIFSRNFSRKERRRWAKLEIDILSFVFGELCQTTHFRTI